MALGSSKPNHACRSRTDIPRAFRRRTMFFPVATGSITGNAFCCMEITPLIFIAKPIIPVFYDFSRENAANCMKRNQAYCMFQRYRAIRHKNGSWKSTGGWMFRASGIQYAMENWMREKCIAHAGCIAASPTMHSANQTGEKQFQLAGCCRIVRKVMQMSRFVPLNKQTKKQKKKYYCSQRSTWGEISPVTRMVPSGKAYNRAKNRQNHHRLLKESYWNRKMENAGEADI